ncbi:MAG: rhomboid family intramembrane serine protease [Succinivibrio sp.]
MAEFEIVDDFVFEVCLLPREKALSFTDYLNSVGIRARTKQNFNEKYSVYVTNSADMTRAKQELVNYISSPYSTRYSRASWSKGKTVGKPKEIRAGILSIGFDLTSLTTLVEITCILVYIISVFNEKAVTSFLALHGAEPFTDIYSYYKLITPTFVHFSLLHIAFNLVMFEALARPIEKRFGTGKLFSLFISVAILSNVLQYEFIPVYTYFGGMSGVVYGVIAYSAIISRRKDLAGTFSFPQGLLAVSVGFIALGFFLDGIANLCHTGGLIVGSLWGLFDLKKKSLK